MMCYATCKQASPLRLGFRLEGMGCAGQFGTGRQVESSASHRRQHVLCMADLNLSFACGRLSLRWPWVRRNGAEIAWQRFALAATTRRLWISLSRSCSIIPDISARVYIDVHAIRTAS